MGFIIVAIDVVVPVFLLVPKKHSAAAQAGNAVISGGDGSVIYVEGNTGFIYSSSFGETCMHICFSLLVV